MFYPQKKKRFRSICLAARGVKENSEKRASLDHIMYGLGKAFFVIETSERTCESLGA